MTYSAPDVVKAASWLINFSVTSFVRTFLENKRHLVVECAYMETTACFFDYNFSFFIFVDNLRQLCLLSLAALTDRRQRSAVIG